MKDIIKAVESLAKMAKEAGAALDSLLGREAEPMPQQPTAAVGSVPTPKTLPGEIGTGSPMAPVMPRTRQATWTGEGDTAAPATPTRKPASFWGQFTLGNVWESTKKEVVGIKRAYEAVTSAPAAVGNAVDSYVARSNALADVSVGDVVGKVREATKDIPPSDAWIGAQMGKLGEWLKTSLIKTSAPPPPMIGVPPPAANENAPSVIKPEVNKSALNDLSATVNDVALAISGLAATTTPSIDTRPLEQALALANRLKAVLRETMNRLSRAQNSD